MTIRVEFKVNDVEKHLINQFFKEVEGCRPLLRDLLYFMTGVEEFRDTCGKKMGRVSVCNSYRTHLLPHLSMLVDTYIDYQGFRSIREAVMSHVRLTLYQKAQEQIKKECGIE